MADEVVQYIIVRHDLRMSEGKMSAQVSHASVGTTLCFYNDDVKRRIANAYKLEEYRLDFEKWCRTAFAKVVLKCKTKQKLLNVMDKLREDGIPFEDINDSCRTELVPENGSSTLTCVGLVPLFRSRVPKYIQKLQMW